MIITAHAKKNGPHADVTIFVNHQCVGSLKMAHEDAAEFVMDVTRNVELKEYIKTLDELIKEGFSKIELSPS
jgi:hypothetical protein